MTRRLTALTVVALIGLWPVLALGQISGKPKAKKNLLGWRNLTWEMTRHNIRLLYAGTVETRSVNELMLHKIKVRGARAQVILKLHALKLMAALIDVPNVDRAFAQELFLDLREEHGPPHRARPGPVLARRLVAARERVFYAWNLSGGALVLVWSRQRGVGLLFISTQQWCADAAGPYLSRMVRFRE
ncbi:MAG: hypothetical protein KJ621_13575 [Proteobacteria bacterium]|nr:hypothetical protein [Pseudomonadota bacterium]MBU1740464.1 hypothetical protein [Pseudomonadota bacterium]